VLANLLRRVKAQTGWLVALPGNRLELEIPAYAVSFTLHALFLVVLALASHRSGQVVLRDLHSQFLDSALAASESTFQDLDQSAAPPAVVPAAGSFAPDLATTITSAPSSASAIPVAAADPAPSNATLPGLVHLDVNRATEIVIPTATMLGQRVSIKGNGVEHVGNVEGAVDRIAVEILRRLEQGRTLVIWAFDASGSLQAERQRLSKHIETVYTHINQLDEARLAADKGLLSLVVAFGHDRSVMTPKPTAELSEILEAIDQVPTDETGIESTFTTVAEMINRWGRYRDQAGQVYHPMVIVVTDEVGDDENRLEQAIELALRAKVPVYVLGSQALFGRTKGYVDYVDPKTKHVFHGVPVDQGPESAMLEQIHLPFWYGGPQYDIVEAGFGPYALSRLASATGGIYFVTRFTGQRLGFDPMRMKEYKPDWVRRDQYEAAIARSPLRQAVINAGQITQQRLPGMPRLVFPPVESPEFKNVMAASQALAERTAYTVEEALGPISAAAKLRDRETSRRWQAHYDLIRGRLLAMKVRCYEYNWACARLKKDPPKFKTPRANAWRLVPDSSIQYSERAAAAAHDADRLLHRVIQEHPDTPWALLAQRELRDPFGFKWVETYAAPAPRADQNAEAAQRKIRNMPAAKPPEMPKL
jgi:uncharacterized protein YegL